VLDVPSERILMNERSVVRSRGNEDRAVDAPFWEHTRSEQHASYLNLPVQAIQRRQRVRGLVVAVVFVLVIYILRFRRALRGRRCHLPLSRARALPGSRVRAGRCFASECVMPSSSSVAAYRFVPCGEEWILESKSPHPINNASKKTSRAFF
jgi:hypothetical protein